jgi:phosphonate transport system permease protein
MTNGSAAQGGNYPGAPLPISPLTTLVRTLFAAATVAVLVWAWHSAEMNPVALFADAGNMAELGRDFLKPDFADWRFYMRGMLETIAIAVWGTLLAVLVGVPMALLSSSNVMPAWITFPIRRLMDALRAINELVFALIFIAAVGLGPFAGVLAIFLHTTGVIAKLFSEAVESIDHGPVEGIRGTGATKLHEIIYGVIPQVMPLWISFTLYRFESNVRSATVIGIVGGGGIGMTFNELMRSFQYGQAGAVLIIVVVLVSALDIFSQRIRARFI